jgi:hypothetical protein
LVGDGQTDSDIIQPSQYPFGCHVSGRCVGNNWLSADGSVGVLSSRDETSESRALKRNIGFSAYWSKCNRNDAGRAVKVECVGRRQNVNVVDLSDETVPVITDIDTVVACIIGNIRCVAVAADEVQVSSVGRCRSFNMWRR